MLDRIADSRKLPVSITVDNGPELRARPLMNVHIGAAYHPGFIRPGRPVENDYIESLNGRFRDECLNDHWFLLLRRARATIQAWRDEYNGQVRTAAWAGSRRREFAAVHQDTMTDPGGGAAQPDTQRLAADSNFKPD